MYKYIIKGTETSCSKEMYLNLFNLVLSNLIDVKHFLFKLKHIGKFWLRAGICRLWPVGWLWPYCLFLHSLWAGFYIFKWWGINQKNISWYIKNIGKCNSSVHKKGFIGKQPHTLVYILSVAAELSNCSKDHMVHKVYKVFTLWLYRKTCQPLTSCTFFKLLFWNNLHNHIKII